MTDDAGRPDAVPGVLEPDPGPQSGRPSPATWLDRVLVRGVDAVPPTVGKIIPGCNDRAVSLLAVLVHDEAETVTPGWSERPGVVHA